MPGITQVYVRLYHRQELQQTVMLYDQVELGRQRPGEPAPFNYDSRGRRLIIAALDDKLISREQLKIALCSVPHSDGRPQVSITNLSKKRPILVDALGKLEPGATTEVPVNCLISFEDIAVQVESQAVDGWELRTLPHQTLAPVRGGGPVSIGSAQRSIIDVAANDQFTPEQLIRWLSETMEVLQSAAGASDFLMQAVDAVDRIVGFDAIAAVRFEGRKWEVVASKTFGDGRFGDPATLPSNTILQQVLDLKRTVRHLPATSDFNYSLQGVEALVASPILDPDGDAIGAIYGVRCGTLLRHLPQISDLEATMVEVIGCGAAAGIARESEQKKALAARVLFEQFFTPQLASELESDPQMLDGREAEISVLFCDIVRFSAISQRIGSHKTLQWINDVMDRLSVVVLKHDGVVVDYIGDELMAMWGAPKPQADHALKACLAACDLLTCKAEIDIRWLAEVGEPIDFRTGICSGIATVGNIGSSRKFKYGPLGETVNLASRLQGVAKHFGVRQVISNSTAAGLSSSGRILCRPLGTVRVVNMDQPVNVFELCERPSPDFEILATGFSRAIKAIESNDMTFCNQQVEQLKSRFPNDTAVRMLAARLETGDPIEARCIWRFDTK
ncbi:MAG TPA: hypothetical protein DDZ51_13840 [Planctomycetaceae bacterium]|nr:hypothetical protein [Planctomycetaceae bacterium]